MNRSGSLEIVRTHPETTVSATTVGVAQSVSVSPRRKMTKTARVYKIEMLIRNRGHVSFQTLLDELEVSPATLKRDLDYLKDQLGAPILYDRFLNGYRFGEEFRGQKHELPGLWFSERELYSLLMAHQLLSELDSDGVISRHLQPLLDRIHQMLGTGEADAKALLKRVKIIGSAKRPVSSQFFELVGEALLKRRRLHMRYLTRGRGEVSEREVSPQRLVHYRNTWYDDAWCHSRERLLRFALDAIEHATAIDTRAKDVPLKQVEAEMDAGYGIYAGNDVAHLTTRMYLSDMEPAMKPTDAFACMAHREIDRVPIDDLEGRITSTLLTPYPPGIPLLIPGERFNATIVRYLRFARDFNERFPGFETDVHGLVKAIVGGKAVYSVDCVR